VKINLSIPSVLVERIEERIRLTGAALSVADFLRQAAVKELEHQEAGALGQTELLAPVSKRGSNR
jgi:hypothetical protein